MQTIWSRAAPTPSSCRCTSCISAATAIARRATTSATRRRLKVGDTFTAFYSAIFATAALVDAKIKEDRRNGLDRMIKEAREDVKIIDETIVRRRDTLENPPQTEGGVGPYSRAPRSWSYVLERARPDRSLVRTGIRKQFSVGRLSRRLGSYSSPETEETDVEPDGRLPEHGSSKLGIRERPTDHRYITGVDTLTDTISRKKLTLPEKWRKIENSIANLVSQLLECSMRHYSVEMRHPNIYDTQTQKADVLHDLKEDLLLLKEIEHLQAPLRQRRYPCYMSKDPPMPLGDVGELNSTIRELCRKCVAGRIHMDALIPKICYKLLVATAPPNLDTYNILIIYFTRMRRNKLVDIVLDSMLETGQIPNEVTISSMIKFYTATGNRSGFNRLVRLMSGYDDGLLRSQQTSSGFPDSNPDSQAQTRPVPRNVIMFGAAINASLKLGTAQQAQRWYLEMIREGYIPTPPILTSILQSCALRREWLSGWITWLTLKEVWRSRIIGDNFPWAAYSWMLKLCCWCNRRVEFEEIFKEAVRRGLNPIAHPPVMKTKGLPTRNKSKCPSTEEIRKGVYQILRHRANESNPSIEEAWDKLRTIAKEIPVYEP
ncbi:MAG: hypothetical protein M1840_004211 [Geoglossum simile]|nr:MAG: hypothetical protein M1840_004211 [Geoglossum simile]